MNKHEVNHFLTSLAVAIIGIAQVIHVFKFH